MLKTIFSKAMYVGRAAVFTVGLAVMIAMLLGLLLTAKLAHAKSTGKTFTVQFTTDNSDASPGDGHCDTISALPGDQCTLRAAIQEANKFPGADTIKFDISASDLVNTCSSDTGVCTISPNSELPPIEKRVTIDGYSQPGASPNTNASPLQGSNANLLIELDGTNAGPFIHGLVIQASHSVIKGLVINRFKGSGIFVVPGVKGTRVEGNFIGTDPLAPWTGATPAAAW